MKFMKRLRAAYLLGLTIAILTPIFEAQTSAWATDLNGFSIKTRGKAVTVTLDSDQPVTYTTERQDRQLTITLSNAKLSKRLIEDGMPVVIDDQNRFIGRAVPSTDGKVKIILPNLPAEGYSVSIRQQRDSASGGTMNIRPLVGPEAPKNSTSATLVKPSVNTLLKPRSAVKTNSKQAFDQMLAKLPVASHGSRPSMLSFNSRNNGVTPPQAIKDRLNAPSPMMLTTVEPNSENGGTRPGTIWNPYVVKVSPMPKNADSTTETTQEAPFNLYSSTSPPSVSRYEPTPHFDADPYARLHALANSPSYLLPTPPSFPITNGLPSNFHTAEPILPEPTEAKETTTTLATTDKPDKPVSAKSSKTTQTTKAGPPSIGEMLRRLLTSSSVNWLWIAVGLFLSGIGIFCLLGSAVLGRVLFARNLGSLFRPDAPIALTPLPPLAEAPRPAPATFQQNHRRPLRPGLGFADVALVNALDYTHRSTTSLSDAVRSNPFRERAAARTHVKPQARTRREPTLSN